MNLQNFSVFSINILKLHILNSEPFKMKKYYFLLFLFGLGLVWSGIHPYRYWHWIGEVAPAIVGLVLLILTFRKFRFTIFTYSIILISCYLLFIGAHYTFSKVPLFTVIKDYFGHSRNNFDKLGHFIQGIVPVLISREVFIRRRYITGYKLISFISFCICMATTSVYELIEYIVFLWAGKNPEAFLGMQGDIWDSQTDMLAAALGGLFTLIFLRKIHNLIIEKEFPGTFSSVKFPG
jgi:putative membrane protein